MKVSDFRAIERHVKIVEAAKTLAAADIKGLSVQVIVDGPQRGEPVPPMFVPYDDPGYAAIMAVMQPKLDAAKVASKAAIDAFIAKAAAPAAPTA